MQQTYCEDHDPLDILVLGQESLVPLYIVRAKPIGRIKMIDKAEVDDKIIAVHFDGQEYAHYQTIDELPPHRLDQVRRFFEDYKALPVIELRYDGANYLAVFYLQPVALGR